YPNVNIHNF
nr:Chain C, NANO-PEPTIDE [unidentified]1LD9_F Chain F, NANO-PEPTIDE [unidentified]